MWMLDEACGYPPCPLGACLFLRICGRPAGGLSGQDPARPSAARNPLNTDDNVRCFSRLPTGWRMLIQIWGESPYRFGAWFSTRPPQGGDDLNMHQSYRIP